MKKIVLLCMLAGSCYLLQAQVVPSGRLYDWDAALDMEYPQGNITVLDISFYGGVGDSLTDNAPALTNAFAALSGAPGIITFPPGKYLFRASVNVPAGVVIKGAGADSTRFYVDLGGAAADCFRVTGNTVNNFRPVTTGFTKGSRVITVADISGLGVGAFAEIRQDNGSWDSNPASWATYSVGQILRIDSIVDSLVYLKYPLRIDYDTLLMPEIRPMDLALYNGFQCFYIERIDQPFSGAGYNFLFDRAAFAWMEGVVSNKSVGSHVMLELSTNIHIKGSYFYDAFTFDGSGTRGYGVTINNHSGQCLVENNIFRRLRHAMMVKHGANGNVFAYNYSREPKRSEPINDYSGDISLHGHYPYANLFEGNIIQNIITDHYWGPSGPGNTFLRNRAELFGIIITSGMPNTASQNYVGNETTNNGFLMGQFNMTGLDHFHYGNHILGTTIPPGTQNLTDSSYYRATVPPFWYIPTAWPGIGYPTTGSYSIPAKERYLQQYFSLCEETELGFPTLDNPVQAGTTLMVFPNPFMASFQVETTENYTEIRVFSSEGKLVYTGNGTWIDATAWVPGIYFLQLLDGENILSATRILKK